MDKCEFLNSYKKDLDFVDRHCKLGPESAMD